MGQDVFNKELQIETHNGTRIMSFTITPEGLLENFNNCEIADIDEDFIRIQIINP